MTDINKQKFLAELGKLLTFMYDEDRQAALAAYSSMFDNARDEQLLLQFLVSPTRQAVVIARAYNVREHKLQVNSQSREGHIDDDASRGFMQVLDGLRAEAAEKNLLTAETPAEQFSLFADAEPPAEAVPEQANAAAEAVELEDEPQAEPLAMQEVLAAEFENELPAAETPAKAAEIPAEEPVQAVGAVSLPAEPLNEETVPAADAEFETVELGGDEVDIFLSDFTIANDELDGAAQEEAPAVPAPPVEAVSLGDGSRADKGSLKRREKSAETERAGKAAAGSTQGTESIDITAKKPIVPLLILFTVAAVPVAALCIALLLIPTLLSLAVAAFAVIVGCAALTSAFGAFAIFADVMVVLGASMLTLALGLLFLWLFVWLIGGAIAGLINSIIKLGSRWCYKEVPAA